jgi:biopolymer transport protein ExbD
MKFQPRPVRDVDVNLTPLIDVVFLLLIFFMVTTTFERHAELKIDLPEASTEPLAGESKDLELVIDAQGRYYLDGKELVNTRAETVYQALQEAIADNTETPLIIRADAMTPHQAVVTAMDAAGRLGLNRMSIATTPSEGDQ